MALRRFPSGNRLSTILLFAILVGGGPSSLSASEGLVSATDWEYRWGEPPVDSNGVPLWVYEKSGDSQWKSFSYRKLPEDTGGGQTLWVRFRLPENLPSDPYLLNYNLLEDMEIYIGSRMVVKIGQVVRKEGLNKEAMWPLYKIMDSETSQWVVFKYSTPNKLRFESVLVGNLLNLYQSLITRDAARLIVGSFCILIALITMLIMRGLKQGVALLSFASFTLGVGLVLFIDSLTMMILTNFSETIYAINGWAMLLLPMGNYVFTESIFAPGRKTILRWVLRVHAVFAVSALILGLFYQYNLYWWLMIGAAVFIMMITGLLAVYVFIVRVAIRGDVNAHIYLGGITAFSVAGIHDSLVGLRLMPYSYLVLEWGVLIFIISLAWIMKRKFRESHRQLEDYRQNLEKKVEERSEELKQKNTKLSRTLKQLKNMQNQIITQEKLASLGALTAGIAHEIKNPLNFINNFSALSVEQVKDISEEIQNSPELSGETKGKLRQEMDTLAQFASKTKRHGERADNIVNSMLQHSRGKAGEFKKVNLNLLFEEYIQLAYHGMRAGNPDFNVEIIKELEESGMVLVDSQSLSRAFLNLLNNSFQAVWAKSKSSEAGYKPKVFTAITNKPKHIEIRIQDNGPGIEKNIIKKIFNPFFTTKASGEGTGLGLSIAHDIIVQEHKGKIKVKSEEMEGAEFIIEIPKK